MSKLIASYMLLFLIFAYFSSIAEGGGGIVTTTLNEDLTATDTTITVISTEGFLEAASFIVGDEEIAYTATAATEFQNCSRGHRGTDAEAHDDGRLVYSQTTGVLNRALGFNVMSTGEDFGTLAVVGIAFNFFAKSIGYLVTFNFGILGGQLVYLRYLFMAPAVGFVVYLGFMAMTTAFGILRR